MRCKTKGCKGEMYAVNLNNDIRYISGNQIMGKRLQAVMGKFKDYIAVCPKGCMLVVPLGAEKPKSMKELVSYDRWIH